MGSRASEPLEMQEAAEEGRATSGKLGSTIFQTDLTNRVDIAIAQQPGENPESGLDNLRYYDKCEQDMPQLSTRHHANEAR